MNSIHQLFAFAALAVLLVTSATAFAADPPRNTITRADFGKLPDGRIAHLYTLTNRSGLIAKITDYGAVLTELHVRDNADNLGNIVLGYDNLDQYITASNMFGATVGRVANRTAGAKFSLDGKDYTLTSYIHGGRENFSRKLWDAQPTPTRDGPSLILKYTSADGEEGFPGKLDCTVTYTLADLNELRIEYQAVTDKPTIVNLTNHTYFNLAGAGSGDVRKHVLSINADKYTVFDRQQIPTGEIAAVEGTPLDFRKAKAIGEDIDKLNGYDHNFVLSKPLGELGPCATVTERTTGRIMEVFTTEPGVQLYTANNLNNARGIGGAYTRYGGLCLETQHHPDSIHHPDFPTIILRPGQTYKSQTVFRFRPIDSK